MALDVSVTGISFCWSGSMDDGPDELAPINDLNLTIVGMGDPETQPSLTAYLNADSVMLLRPLWNLELDHSIS